MKKSKALTEKVGAFYIQKRGEKMDKDVLYGEISVVEVDTIPVSSMFDLDALKSGDQSPLEVVVSVPVGKSKRNWNYTHKALNDIVNAVNQEGLSGFLGHQKAENIATEFPQPVTHWIGAEMQDDQALFRGLIDQSAGDLKRWIKGKSVRQVSIFGQPKLKHNKTTGEMDVTDYRPLSIDWTPLNRAGMPTEIITINGEMEGKNMDKKELLAELKQKIEAGEITFKEAAGEMGIALEEFEAGKQALEMQKKLAKETLVNSVVQEKVEGEMAQTLVKRMLQANDDVSKDVLEGEIDKLLLDPIIAQAINLAYQNPSPLPVGNTRESVNNLKIKKVRI